MLTISHRCGRPRCGQT